MKPKVILPDSMIEEAEDSLKDLDVSSQEEQLKELHEACGDRGADFDHAFLLGVQTARVYLLQNPPAVEAGIEL